MNITMLNEPDIPITKIYRKYLGDGIWTTPLIAFIDSDKKVLKYECDTNGQARSCYQSVCAMKRKRKLNVDVMMRKNVIYVVKEEQE